MNENFKDQIKKKLKKKIPLGLKLKIIGVIAGVLALFLGFFLLITVLNSYFSDFFKYIEPITNVYKPDENNHIYAVSKRTGIPIENLTVFYHIYYEEKVPAWLSAKTVDIKEFKEKGYYKEFRTFVGDLISNEIGFDVEFCEGNEDDKESCGTIDNIKWLDDTFIDTLSEWLDYGDAKSTIILDLFSTSLNWKWNITLDEKVDEYSMFNFNDDESTYVGYDDFPEVIKKLYDNRPYWQERFPKYWDYEEYIARLVEYMQSNYEDSLEKKDDGTFENEEWVESILGGNTYIPDLDESLIIALRKDLIWPVPNSFNITSPFGERIKPGKTKKEYHMHKGIDIGARINTPVVASGNGYLCYHIQRENGKLSGYGKYAVIEHKIDGKSIYTYYAHLNTFANNDKEGICKNIKQGDVIGGIGSTGYSTGPHLHFGIKNPDLSKDTFKGVYQKYETGGHLDPMSFISKKDWSIK